MVIAGTGASQQQLMRAAAGLPISFLGHLTSRQHVAEVLAAADVALSPGAAGDLRAGGPRGACVWHACGCPPNPVRWPSCCKPPFGESAYNHGRAMAGALGRVLAYGDRRTARAPVRLHWTTTGRVRCRRCWPCTGWVQRWAGQPTPPVAEELSDDVPVAPVVVVARYAGAVEVLVGLLRAGGHRVDDAAAIDRDGGRPGRRGSSGWPSPRARASSCVVSPADPTLTLLGRLADDGTVVVAVSWHPPDERPDTRGLGSHIVPAGRIRLDLAATVTSVSARS